MVKNKKYYIPIIIIVVLLGLTIYKIIKNREENLYKSLYGEIEYAAKQCFLKKECTTPTTLEELYKLNYLETKYDPVTKEILDGKMKIEYKESNIIIHK